MLNSSILDIVIGFSFLFFLLSNCVTLIVELLSSWMNIRSKNLKKGIQKLLDDIIDNKGNNASGLSKLFFEHPMITSLTSEKKALNKLKSDKFARVVIDILNKESAKNKGKRTNKTTQLSNGNISSSIDIVSSKNYFDQTRTSETVDLLKTFAEEAREDINEFQQKLENWFDEQGDQMRDWFAAEIRTVTLMVSVFVVFALNVDSIRIYKALSKNDKLRMELANSAAEFLENHKDVEFVKKDSANYTKEIAKIYNESLKEPMELMGIGWKNAKGTYSSKDGSGISLCAFATSILGMIISILAISLGAPFWYDVLTRVNRLKNAANQTNTTTSATKTQPVA